MEVSDEVIQFLRDQAWAQVESNRLLAEKLSIDREDLELKQRELDLIEQDLQLKRKTENRRDGRLSEVIARYADLGEQVQGVVETGNIADVILREAFEEFSGEIRIIKRGLYALLSRDGGAIAKAKGELQAEFAQEEIQELLLKQQRNLFKLKARQAQFGMNAPLELLNEIEQTEAEIARLQEQKPP